MLGMKRDPFGAPSSSSSPNFLMINANRNFTLKIYLKTWQFYGGGRKENNAERHEYYL